MKLPSLFAAMLIAAASSSVPVQAASDKAAAPPDATQADKPAGKMHSHVQEKTGIPQSAPEKKTGKPDPAKDMSKHYHPRDNK